MLQPKPHFTQQKNLAEKYVHILLMSLSFGFKWYFDLSFLHTILDWSFILNIYAKLAIITQGNVIKKAYYY